MKKNIERVNEEGFSLVELVITVSILLILSVGGSVGYITILNGYKQTTMELTANTVMNKIMSNIMDFDPNTNVKTAVDEFNEEVNSDMFNIYTIVDETGCVNIVVEDDNIHIDPVYMTKDKLCNLSEEEIG